MNNPRFNRWKFLFEFENAEVLQAEAVGICDHHKIPIIKVQVTNQDGWLICHVTGMGYLKNMNVHD